MPYEVGDGTIDQALAGVLAEPAQPETPPSPPAIEQNDETIIKAEPALTEQPELQPEPLPEELKEILEEDEEKPAEPAAPATETPAANPIDLNSSRGKRIYNGYKFFKAVEGELGVIPTVDEVKEFHRAHLERLAMENEFSSGDPRAADNWVANWDRISPRGMTAVAAVLPDRLLADRNTDAYAAMATPVITRFIDSLYESAKVTVDPEAKARLIDAARVAEHRLTGKYRPDEELTRVEDPMVARQNEVDAKLARIQKFEAEQFARQQAEIVSGIDSAIDTQIANMVGEAMKPLHQAYPSNKAYVEMCQKAFTAKVIETAQSSPSLNAYRQEVARAANGDAAARQRAVNLFASMAAHAIQAQQRTFLREHIKSSELVKASQERHQRLQQAVPQSPQGTPSPAGRSMAPSPSGKKTLDQALSELLGTGPNAF